MEAAAASGGLRNRFAEWVRQSGFEEWVFGVSGMGVVGCNLIGLSLNKKKWRGLQMMPCGLGIT